MVGPFEGGWTALHRSRSQSNCIMEIAKKELEAQLHHVGLFHSRVLGWAKKWPQQP